METTDLSFMSATGQNRILPNLYLPESGHLSALMLIIHGMAEHQLRYHPFAMELCRHDIGVCTFDLPGHGVTAPDEKHLGFFAREEGADLVLRDVDTLIDKLRNQWPDTKIILFGHSMGSMIARCYAAGQGGKLDAVVFSGTTGPNPAVGLALWLSRRSIRKNGPFYRDKNLDKLMSKDFHKHLPEASASFAWLTRDAAIVQHYEEDPLCGYVFTAAGFRDLFTWLRRISAKNWAAAVPHNLPVLLLSGEEDPVGQFGKGVRQVRLRLAQSGHSVEMKLYPDGRHEMLNEINHEAVWQDILHWLQPIVS